MIYSSFPLAISFTHGSVNMSKLLSIHRTLSFPNCVHKSILYVCVSISVLQTGSLAFFKKCTVGARRRTMEDSASGQSINAELVVQDTGLGLL